MITAPIYFTDIGLWRDQGIDLFFNDRFVEQGHNCPASTVHPHGVWDSVKVWVLESTYNDIVTADGFSPGPPATDQGFRI